MDGKRFERDANPEEGINIISKIFFLWTSKIFRRGIQSSPLTVHEICRPLPEDTSDHLGNILEEKWMLELKKAKKSGRQPKLLYAVIKAFGLGYSSLAVMHGINELFLRLIQPILLGELLSYFTTSSEMTLNGALMYASCMIGSIFLSYLLSNHYLKKTFQYGMRLRVACSSVIYRKALRISKTALGDTASGQVVNLLSNDISRFDLLPIFFHFMWSAPLAAIAVMYYMWIKAGPISLVGILAILVLVPIQSYTGRLASKFRLQTAYKTDERIRLMNEIICGIQVIKMYAWEKPFSKRVSAARAKELEKLKRSAFIRGLYMTFQMFTTRFSIFCTMMALSLSGGSLSPEKIFVYSTYLSMLSFNMAGMYVRGVQETAESFVSFGRLTKFLVLQEITEVGDYPKAVHESQNGISKCENRGEIKLQEASASWQPDLHELTLQNISLSIEKGNLTAVVGPVGCGKSSLLQAILGELKFSEGKISISGIISYCSQEPWVFAASVRQNITFGLPFDKIRYAEVVRICALAQDFCQFAEGDKTIIGDRGASLSGGQRARINLARAVYKDADIYLLDDPLSAVDSHVAKHLMEECISGFLKNKTRILVTHQLQYLRKADFIVVMDNGATQLQGTFETLAKSDIDFAKLLQNEEEMKKEEEEEESGDTIALVQKVFRKISVTSNRSVRSSKTAELTESVESLVPEGQAPMEEIRAKVNASVLSYILSGVNKCSLFVLFCFFVLAQTAASLCDFWMSVWVTQDVITQNKKQSTSLIDYDEPNNLTFPEVYNETLETGLTESFYDMLTTEICQIVYSVLIVSLFVIALTRSLVFYSACIKCSQKLHDLMFVKICQTYMSFFHTNPSGRILNRFSKDLGSVDEFLPKALLDSFQNIMIGFGAIVVTLVVNYIYIIPLILIMILGCLTRYVFVKTSTGIRKIEGITRSPVFGHLNETLQGLTTIRAYGAEKILKKEFDNHLDLHSGTVSLFIGVSSAFGLLIDFLCLMLVAFVTFLLILVKNNLTGGEVGLAITQILGITELVQWGIRQSAEISNQLVSVERVLEYTEIESEENLESAPREKEMEDTLSSWPKEGSIEFKNVFLYYGEIESPAIKDLSISVKPGEKRSNCSPLILPEIMYTELNDWCWSLIPPIKIGIVGRTGAGKSSIITALFRLAKVEGSILIDGIDTSIISLQRLRKSISIIPQEPVLFVGSIRKNLDPFEDYSDAKLWQALEEVELKDALVNGLDSVVQEGGNNFSVGQKQLLCLARAILRNNRILLLDEATANVDLHTDSLIQKTIRGKFEYCTVFTIAHRLNTVMDYDKVLVMDEGTMVEFDKPYNLLQRKDGCFTKMVQKTGSMAEQLRSIAEKHKS